MTRVAASQRHTLPVKLLLVICAAASSCVVLKSVYAPAGPTLETTYLLTFASSTDSERSAVSLDLGSETEWKGVMISRSFIILGVIFAI